MATIVWHSQSPPMKKLEMGSIDSPRFSTSSSVSRIMFGISSQVDVCEYLFRYIAGGCGGCCVQYLLVMYDMYVGELLNDNDIIIQWQWQQLLLAYNVIIVGYIT